MKTYREFLLEQSQLDILNEMSMLGYVDKKQQYVSEIIPITGGSGSKHGCHIHIYKCDGSGRKIKSSKLRFGVETGDLIEDNNTDKIKNEHYKNGLNNVKKEGRKYIEKYKSELLCVCEDSNEISDHKELEKKFDEYKELDRDELEKLLKENNTNNKSSGSGDDTYDPVKRRQYYEETRK